MGASHNTPKPCPDPPTLYHGSPAKLEVGEVIVAGLVVKASRSPWVWMTNDPDDATNWGIYRIRRSQVRSAEPVTIFTYEVEPVGEVHTARHAWRSRSARVVRLVGTRRVACPPAASMAGVGSHC